MRLKLSFEYIDLKNRWRQLCPRKIMPIALAQYPYAYEQPQPQNDIRHVRNEIIVAASFADKFNELKLLLEEVNNNQDWFCYSQAFCDLINERIGYNQVVLVQKIDQYIIYKPKNFQPPILFEEDTPEWKKAERDRLAAQSREEYLWERTYGYYEYDYSYNDTDF